MKHDFDLKQNEILILFNFDLHLVAIQKLHKKYLMFENYRSLISVNNYISLIYDIGRK